MSETLSDITVKLNANTITRLTPSKRSTKLSSLVVTNSVVAGTPTTAKRSSHTLKNQVSNKLRKVLRFRVNLSIPCMVMIAKAQAIILALRNISLWRVCS